MTNIFNKQPFLLQNYQLQANLNDLDLNYVNSENEKNLILTIEIKDHKTLTRIGAEDWIYCLDERYYDENMDEGQQMFVVFDFNKSPRLPFMASIESSPDLSTILVVTDTNGKIETALCKDSWGISDEDASAFEFPKLETNEDNKKSKNRKSNGYKM